ncbi:MAG TPA: heavy metal translocating P-type ATPase [Bacillus sp. (in: firmicutes)]|uniref:heavy metal translocating P-type ATPase n=1 Tax=Bacillus litorisediminis TaxID=2922713 RepID=UPI001FAF96D7|nr:heavy metal translocating P-type ATPase [Bacillus litorisediminis]HWO76936.1 heavy metal translocating P-type ATPase [Bacillus sp. (in: firmicutes)]
MKGKIEVNQNTENKDSNNNHHHHHSHNQQHSRHEHSHEEKHTHHEHSHPEKQNQSEHSHNHTHHSHAEHKDQSHHNHHAHHGHMIEDFKRRFWISLIVTIPILFLSPMIQMFLNVDWRFPYDSYILFGLASFVFFYGGWPFLTGARDELRQKQPGMMTLIALAIVVAYVYSVMATFGLTEGDFYWELATLIDIMLLGHWIEMKSIMGASRALEELVQLMPSEAHLLKDNGEIIDIQIKELKEGDLVLVKPGEKLPVDGKITDGNSTIDESMLTGESVPIEKGVGDQAIGGSINGEGSLTIRVEKTGESTYLSQVINLVKEAQETKSKTQDLSNRAAKWLFYLAVGAGIVTLVIWLLLGYPFSFALERMVTVMIISCPHALGLAAPLVVAVSTAISAKKGLLIRNRAHFENARNITGVVFDKTGTLTKGEFGVTNLLTENGFTDEQVLQLAASLESKSQHPIADGIVKEAHTRNLKLSHVHDFKSLTGKGLEGIIAGRHIMVVSPGYVKNENIQFNQSHFNEWSSEGKTVVFVLVNRSLVGMIALADIIRESAKIAIHKLKDMGIKSYMLTGDNQKVANYVAKQLDMDDVIAEVLPHQKSEKIEGLQKEGLKIAMTGDGVNDAPALVKADLGIAVGAGTDVAIESADVILVNSNPEDVVNIVKLSKATYKKMIQNLWWAAGYNIIAIPLAAGVLYNAGIVLSPALGAVLMSLSTIIVAINAKTLKI